MSRFRKLCPPTVAEHSPASLRSQSRASSSARSMIEHTVDGGGPREIPCRRAGYPVLLTGLVAAAGFLACTGGADWAPDGEGSLEVAQQADDDGSALPGKHDFNHALPHTNGRSCASCHPGGDHFALLPASVEARFQANPQDRLFDPLDADDPTAAQPTYNHLRKRALIRITLPLPPNIDLVDDAGNVVTNPERKISVWRGVPTVENTALTAPFLYDGRATTLQQQALGALRDHSAIKRTPAPHVLDDIAAFEKTVFSSHGVREVANALAEGKPAPDPDPRFSPGSPEALGKALFQTACAPCHGGPTGTQIVNRAVQDDFFPVLDANGSPEVTTLPDGTIIPVLSHDHPNDDFLVLGISLLTYLTQIPPDQGGIPNPDGLDFPHYRLRFYTDGTRAQKRFDLPPAPPLIGRNFFPQAFTVDPGRCIITGDPLDFEAFDVPQLRGISHTAPYFHDNSAPDLPTLLDIYSQFILPAIPPLGLPPVVPPAGPGLPPESLTAAQKAQLIAYLRKI
jgi:cytochrome c peroxidase